MPQQALSEVVAQSSSILLKVQCDVFALSLSCHGRMAFVINGDSFRSWQCKTFHWYDDFCFHQHVQLHTTADLSNREGCVVEYDADIRNALFIKFCTGRPWLLIC